MDESDKENSPEPAQPKRFRPAEGESILFTGPPNSIASLATRAQRRHAWSEMNGSRECQGSFVAPAISPGHLTMLTTMFLLIRPLCQNVIQIQY